MKASIITLIAAQTMSLALAAPTAGDRGTRSVIAPRYKFEVYKHQACRGTHGKHDNKDSYYERIRASPSQCREYCEEDNHCTGYETGKDKHCELWNSEIGDELERMHDLSCYVKETYYPEMPHYDEYEYDVEKHRACRGTKGKQDNDEDYYKLAKLSGPDCRKECDRNSWCTGYETGTNDRCELWSHFIGDSLPKKQGFACYTKQEYFNY
ncbi:hypothetical protein SARC_02098 [Sphaeroforma arctica JP610]|uniref:Apple domain-containing protein n=1 Tax=Sphaeroforma arctica JP610 TaxID=667725 RepID=A0A0L0G9Z2_9EUKA|nr:hypothetical protein SARC_02098 [Sphaeroforma arctica JP610]KNC85724.1 hypothetical protein SARC_02098 [Sphaeroforma arctica JP610]|eukprot:XP_014159626.1 hypothetical protein SARC_02098 [Sphaeroforma arctica JP610]